MRCFWWYKVYKKYRNEHPSPKEHQHRQRPIGPSRGAVRRIAYQLFQQDQGTPGGVENQRTQPVEREGPRVIRAVPGGHSLIVQIEPITPIFSRKYKEIWAPCAHGNTVFTLFRDGNLVVVGNGSVKEVKDFLHDVVSVSDI